MSPNCYRVVTHSDRPLLGTKSLREAVKILGFWAQCASANYLHSLLKVAQILQLHIQIVLILPLLYDVVPLVREPHLLVVDLGGDAVPVGDV